MHHGLPTYEKKPQAFFIALTQSLIPIYINCQVNQFEKLTSSSFSLGKMLEIANVCVYVIGAP